MQRVAVLSHVKASPVPPRLDSSSARRIAWHGGTISSNKVDALQKFYQRKLRAGDHLTAQQIEAMQATLGVKLDRERAHHNPRKGRLHVKATVAGNHTVLRTGRVLGPKIKTKQKGKKKGSKHQARHQPMTTVKMPQEQAETISSISLEDKLGLPLHALVEGKTKRSRKQR